MSRRCLERFLTRTMPSFSRKAMRMTDDCLTWLLFQQEATVANTATLVQLHELAAKKRESSRRQSILIHFLGLLWQVMLMIKLLQQLSNFSVIGGH